LSAAEIATRFPNRANLIAGWRVPGAIAIPPHELLVLVDRQFPWSLPLVATPQSTGGITVPHLERDGNFCIAASGARFDLPAGIEHVAELIESAKSIIENGVQQPKHPDFLDEIHSYWPIVSPTSTCIWITSPLPPASALWYAFKYNEDYFAGPAKARLEDWLLASGRKPSKGEPCVVVRLACPLFPADYPSTPADLLRLIQGEGAVGLLDSAIKRWSMQRHLPVILVFAHNQQDYCVGAFFVPPREIQLPGARHRGIKGFRTGKKLPAAAVAVASQRFPHAKAIPIYREYLHARTSGAVPESLVKAHVVVAGCGALGGEVALHLAKAGVGRLTLVDPELFDWRNVGRHVLDGLATGEDKATSLAGRLKRSFPDAQIDAFHGEWQDWAAQHAAIASAADMVLALTGEPAGNAQLDMLVERGDVAAALYGFTEAFAVAGHAVLQLPGSGRLKFITDSSGVLLEQVVSPSSISPALKREPACGALYQPYSSLAALHTVALIGELALDALTGRVTHSVHRVWVGDCNAFGANAITMSPTWSARVLEGGDNRRFVFQLPGEQ
jgi:sulfur-carrier protein adenylyltransferase/sulfurtransferase